MIGLGRPSDRLAGRGRSAAELFDTHVPSLLALANLLLDDHREAAAVVVRVLREARPGARSGDDRGDRRHLGREVHQRCFSARIDESRVLFGTATRTSSSPMGRRLVTLSDQQRSVIGRCLFGGHTHNETADYLALPVRVVDELLQSGLHRLSGTV